MPIGFYFYPQFAFIRGIYLMNDRCAQDYACYGQLWEIDASDELWHSVAALFIGGVVYFLLGLYLDAVLPQAYGVRKHPLFCCGGGKGRKENEAGSGDGSGEHTALLNATRGERDDEDVRDEAEFIAAMAKPPARHPLVIDGLRKVYDSKPPVVAVRSLSVKVRWVPRPRK